MTDAPQAGKPHAFEEMDVRPLSVPIPSSDAGGETHAPAPTSVGESAVCALCKKPRADRIHIEGKAEADAESPHWGL